MDNNFMAQSMWNFDDSAMKTLKFFSDSCLDAFSNWNLPEINSSLRSLRRISSWGLANTTWDDIEKDFKELEKIKRELEDETKSNKRNENKIKFYNKADEIFIKIGRAMQKEGWVFRKGYDPHKAALRR